jgi:signal peptidase II
MLIGGALGNVVDRLFRGEKWLAGAVVDFIDLQWFPVFNIADSAVTVGAAILILSSLTASRNAKQS